MANFWYGKGIQHFVNGDVNWAANTINVALISATYTPVAATNEFYSVAVAGGAIVSAGVALGTKTNVLGLVGAANTTWSAVSGSQVTQLVGYVGGTAGSGDYLLFNISVGTNLPVTPNGGNITAAWDPTNGIGTLMAALNPRDRIKLGNLLGDFIRKAWTHVKDKHTGLWVPQPAGAFLYTPTIVRG